MKNLTKSIWITNDPDPQGNGHEIGDCSGGRKTVFIGGSKSCEELTQPEKELILAYVAAGYHILIGDCRGIDRAVQDFLRLRGYNHVTVYATDGKARNNLGRWPVAAIPASENTGFAYYRQKDMAMEKDADEMLMFWDQKSKGTCHNLMDMIGLGKPVRVVIRPYAVMGIGSAEDLAKISKVPF